MATTTFTTVVGHEVAFRNILEFVGQPMDFVHLEQTSRPIRQFFLAGGHGDDIWSSCVDYDSFASDPRLATHRDKVLTSMMLKRYQKAQEEEDGTNLFIKERPLSSLRPSSSFKRFLTNISLKPLSWQHGYPENKPIVVSDDTAITFAGLLEANMVDVLKKSFDLACFRTEDGGGYPTVENRDINHASNSLVTRCEMEFGHTVQFLTSPVPDGIVWGLAFRAGIIRLHPETFGLIWALAVKLTALILARTGIQWAHHHPEGMSFNPTPDMVTRTAEILGLPITKVYLDNTLLEDGEGRDGKGEDSDYDPDSESDTDDDEEYNNNFQADFAEWQDALDAGDGSDYNSEEDSDYEDSGEEDIELEYDTEEENALWDSDDDE